MRVVYVPLGTLAMSVPVIGDHGQVISIEKVKFHESDPGGPWVAECEPLGVIFVHEHEPPSRLPPDDEISWADYAAKYLGPIDEPVPGRWQRFKTWLGSLIVTQVIRLRLLPDESYEPAR